MAFAILPLFLVGICYWAAGNKQPSPGAKCSLASALAIGTLHSTGLFIELSVFNTPQQLLGFDRASTGQLLTNQIGAPGREAWVIRDGCRPTQ